MDWKVYYKPKGDNTASNDGRLWDEAPEYYRWWEDKG